MKARKNTRKRRAAATAPKSKRQTTFYQNPSYLASLKSELDYLIHKILEPQPENLRVCRIDLAAQILRVIPPEERGDALGEVFHRSLFPEDFDQTETSDGQETDDV